MNKFCIGLIKKIHEFSLSIYKNKDSITGTIISGDINNVTIGESVSFGGNVVLFCNAPIAIGSHTMVGMQAMLHTSTHDYNKHPMWKVRIDRPISIGKHVWLGARCIILPGVKVGDFSVVGAGSVVTSHVPNGAVVAGNPAKILRYRDLKEVMAKEQWKQDNYPNDAVIIRENFLEEEKIANTKDK